MLLPAVSRAIGEHEGLEGVELESRLAQLKQNIFSYVDAPEKVEAVVIRYCKRQIDRLIKKIDLGDVGTVDELKSSFSNKTAELDISLIAENCRTRIRNCIARGDIEDLLALLGNKGMLAHAARILRANKRDDFEGWLTRVMRRPTIAPGVTAVSSVLPEVSSA